MGRGKTAIAAIQRWMSFPWVITLGYLGVMLVLPTAALIAKAVSSPPAEFWEIATSEIAVSAYNVTFVTAFLAAALNGVFGLLLAWVLVRYEFPGKRWVDAAIDLPFALPTAVAGITLATVYSEEGWIGSLLAPLGIRVAFTRTGVFVAMVFISLPFVVRTLQPVIHEIEREIEESAWCLGATESQTFWKVLFPTLLPAILTGVVLGFSRAIGEFGSVVIVASNIPFEDLIAPVLVFERLENYDYVGATVIGFVLLIISLILILVINLLQQWGRHYNG
ncbi:MAG TPA: sulfate ABC transporter permease subunit CysT [Cyanobacteria bacterium UBA8156]|jgi:sulfate transport system permease protein|nr:sulfate ABC transporter permease subunit CysT [Cyanobacteria bacterium UBA8156]